MFGYPLDTVVIELTVEQGVISAERLKRALLTVLARNSILRTAFKFNDHKQYLEQEIISSAAYSFAKSQYQTDNELIGIREEELTGKFFNLVTGIVTRLHVVTKESSMRDDDDYLLCNDTVFICIHHIAIDGWSGKQFLVELLSAYETNSDCIVEKFRYLDYSIHERTLINSDDDNLQLSETRQFWSDLLQLYRFNSDIFSDVFRAVHRRADETPAWPLQYFTLELELDVILKKTILTFCQEHNFSLFQVCLTLYYVFLFKLTQRTDLCILSLDANRYRPELQSIIGLFINYLPYRLRLDPAQSFFTFLSEVRTLTVKAMEHAYLPYQAIIQQHRNETHQGLQQFLTNLSFELLMNFETETDLDTARIGLRTVNTSQPPPFGRTADPTRLFFTYSTESTSWGDQWYRAMSQRFLPFISQLFSSESLLTQPLCELLVPGELANENVNIDLGEGRSDGEKTESVIRHSCSAIIDCFVAKVRDEEIDDNYLVAFVYVSEDANDTSTLEESIGECCERNLPSFMIPSYFIPVTDRFPNEKRLLLQRLPHCKKISIKTYFIEPATELERKVQGLWCLVLQEEEQISMSANFFSLGGNSYLLLKLCYLYQTELQIDYQSNFTKFYKQPTLREHAQLVKSLVETD